MSATTRQDEARLAVSAMLGCVLLGTQLSGRPGPSELWAMRAANRDRFDHAWWWPVQQLGTPGVLPLITVVAWPRQHRPLAMTATLAILVTTPSEDAHKPLPPRLPHAQVAPQIQLTQLD